MDGKENSAKYDDSFEPLLSERTPDSRHRVSVKYRIIFVISGFILVISCILLGSRVLGLPFNSLKSTPCHTTVRPEWRSLSLKERENYVAAIQCLSNSPSRLGLNTTRYDDFVYSHLGVADDTHGTPISLPWHRLYMQRYEDALRNECGYKDPLPYWDWTLDSSNPTESPVWSSQYGLGGNGSRPDNCLVDGPLAIMKPQYPQPHCLKRNFAVENMHGMEFTSSIVDNIISNTSTYHDFRLLLERGPHRYIHLGIGGEMPELWSSNDPIFFLHHAQIDRLWWRWQRHGHENELRGYDSIDEGLGTSDTGNLISMRDVLKFSGLGDDVTAGDVISTQTSLLCYTYE
ncbi:uncharacterized protein TRUGW13939_09870 [Talaromyces rugulosus]|uniref:Tyrosinase copper-binding domain-containing protein n=1 Tax=Talaromyces rugulosus TaxID=121627 RepID=A0A7H8R8H9_TALRU|nr:uncharacterized protein TRUGW13939_09870 [Talaromyces rugulosus]QKX62709.1 hypothetical protein TRUGW13939_09870 [Talaromyces rugulosus]